MISQQIRDRLYTMSNLDELAHLTFENFSPSGRNGLPPVEAASVQSAYDLAQEYAQDLKGWLLLLGGFGCGKTHLAAAVANRVVSLGVPTLFLTVPDLLDWLRFAFSDPSVSFEERFEQVRTVEFLVLDDFGTQNATPWAQEKLFQILNYRYVNRLPLLVTTNLPLDEIEGRIRSRLQDDQIVRKARIIASDYRLPSGETSTPGLSCLPLLRDKTFGSFSLREDEIGKPIKVTTSEEIADKSGLVTRSKKTLTYQITRDDIELFKKAYFAAIDYADDPQGWLLLMGPSGTGKTFLAAAIGNFRGSSGFPAIMVDTPDLLDYLRATFNPQSSVKYDRRFDEVRTTQLLILDSFGTHQTSAWAEEKLYQILNYRYNAKLPTVIATKLSLEEIEEQYPQILNRILDTRLCKIFTLSLPPFRNFSEKKRTKKREE